MAYPGSYTTRLAKPWTIVQHNQPQGANGCLLCRNRRRWQVILVIQRLWYKLYPVNGGSAYPPGHWCDSYGNLFDPSMVPNYSASCTSASDPTCWGRIHVEFDKDWMAAGYCGIGTASCNNNTMVQQTTATSATTLIDVQGFVYWDPDHLNTTFHSFSGWELHP